MMTSPPLPLSLHQHLGILVPVIVVPLAVALAATEHPIDIDENRDPLPFRILLLLDFRKRVIDGLLKLWGISNARPAVELPRQVRLRPPIEQCNLSVPLDG